LDGVKSGRKQGTELREGVFRPAAGGEMEVGVRELGGGGSRRPSPGKKKEGGKETWRTIIRSGRAIKMRGREAGKGVGFYLTSRKSWAIPNCGASQKKYGSRKSLSGTTGPEVYASSDLASDHQKGVSFSTQTRVSA